MRVYSVARLLARCALLLLPLILLAKQSLGVTPHPATCRISNDLGGSIDWGSGTLIDKSDDGCEGLVLTCAHIFSDGTGRIVVYFPDGKRHYGILIEKNEDADLAAIAVANPSSEPPPISTGPLSGNLYVCGYGGRREYRCVSGGITGRYTSPGRISLEIDAVVRQGDSGGGVFNDQGNFVAVLWGGDSETSMVTMGEPFRKFLHRALGPRATVLKGCRGSVCSPPRYLTPRQPIRQGITPPVVTRQPAVAPAEKKCPCKERLDSQESRIAALETKPATIGPRGPAGQPGKDGRNGMDAVVDRKLLIESLHPAFASFRKNLVSPEAELRLPPITVSQIEAGTGKRLDSQDVYLGGELPLRFGAWKGRGGSQVLGGETRFGSAAQLGLLAGGALSVPLGIGLARKLLV